MTEEMYKKQNKEFINKIRHLISISTNSEDELYTYIKNELGCSPSTLLTRIESLKKHNCILDTDIEILSNIVDKTRSYYRKNQNKETTEKLRKLLSLSTHSEKEIYNYMKEELGYSPSTLLLKIESFKKYDILSDEEVKGLLGIVANAKKYLKKESHFVYNKEIYIQKYEYLINKYISILEQNKMSDAELYQYINGELNIKLTDMKNALASFTKYDIFEIDKLETLATIYERMNVYNSEAVYIKNKENGKIISEDSKKINSIAARKLVNDYISSGIIFTNYCKKNKMNKSMFYKQIDVLKETDPTLYFACIQFIDTQKEILKNAVIDCKEEIINGIRAGILSNGTRRNFDLLDYYNITKINLEDFYNIVKKEHLYTPNEIREFSIFYNVNYDAPLTITQKQEYLDSYTEKKCLLDENNSPIIGSGIEITKKEKIAILYYLESHDIPVTAKSKYLVENRYLNNELFIDKNKQMIK